MHGKNQSVKGLVVSNLNSFYGQFDEMTPESSRRDRKLRKTAG